MARPLLAYTASDGPVPRSRPGIGQQLFHVAVAQAKAEVEPHGVRDDLLGKPEAVAECGSSCLHAPSIAQIRTSIADCSLRCQDPHCILWLCCKEPLCCHTLCSFFLRFVLRVSERSVFVTGQLLSLPYLNIPVERCSGNSECLANLSNRIVLIVVQRLRHSTLLVPIIPEIVVNEDLK